MASKYGYITISDLENHMAINFETRDSSLTDTVIEQRISTAERIVNSIAGKSFSGTIPDNIVSATIIISERLVTSLWNNRHPNDKWELNDKDIYNETIDKLISGRSSLIYDLVDTS